MARARVKEVGTAQLSGRLGPALPPLAALQVCHVTQMTGTLRARRGGRFVNVAFRGGEVVAADSADRCGLEALMEFGQWGDGTFDFVCGPPSERDGVRGPFAGLMLEICRRLDESPSRVRIPPDQKRDGDARPTTSAAGRPPRGV